jgi:integrase
MGSIVKHDKGWRAHVCIQGRRLSKLFKSRRDASNWIAARENEINEDVSNPGAGKTVRDALEKYRDEVSPKKRGGKWEIIRINLILRLGQLPLAKRVSELTGVDFSAWRDARMLTVSGASFTREFSIISAVLKTARTDWGWAAPDKLDFRRPPKSSHRDTIIRWGQIKKMLRTLKYSRNLETAKSRVGLAFLIALRTGMRLGEITGIEAAHLSEKSVLLPLTKNGQSRVVPLSIKTRRLFQKAKQLSLTPLLGVSASVASALFIKSREAAGLAGFTFHDARHTAATMIVRNGKLDVLYLCKMFGWKDPKQAMTYFNPTADELADRL